jgi:carboxypeptidase T
MPLLFNGLFCILKFDRFACNPIDTPVTQNCERGKEAVMRRFCLLLAAALLLVTISIGQAQQPESYHMVRFTNLTIDQIKSLKIAGLPMDEAQVSKEGFLDIPLYESEIRAVADLGVSYSIIQEDLGAYYEARYLQELRNGLPTKQRTDPEHFGYGSMGGFYNYQEIVTALDSMHILYPNICTEKDSLGAGWEGHTIWMVKISDNPEINEDEPEVMFDALHHAREPGSYTAMLYAMWWLLENYGSDPEATHLVDSRQLYFIPVANPDGLIYNQTTNPYGGGNWRKNRRNNGSSYGVDLNRNYGYQWGYDNLGSSPTPSSDTYRGPSAFSEPESATLRDFFLAHDFKTAMTIHTYGNDYLYAYGYANVMPESLAVHQEYGAEVSRENGYIYGTAYQVLYAGNGRVQDWQLHTHLTISIEPEIGANGFWPSTNYIFPEARDNLHCILWMAWCGGAKIDLQGAAPVGGNLEPGQVCSLTVDLKNRGMGDTQTDVIVTLAENSPYISLINPTYNFGTFSTRETRGNIDNPLRLSVMPLTPQGTPVVLRFQIDYDGFVATDSFTVVVGTPIAAFQDNAESGISNWSMGSWGTTTSSYHSPTHSFTDSPYGNYSNNQTNIMTLQGTINLSGFQNPMLKFWTKWAIEAGYDFGQVEASSNGGSSWVPLQGEYTRPGSGQGVQPSGQPGYDGVRTNWVEENMSLAAFIGINNLKIRFEFRSDQGVTDDGWYVDDVRAVGYQQGSPSQISGLIILWTPDGARLEWTPVPGAIIYHVYRDTHPIHNVNKLSTDSTVSGPPYLDADVENISQRFYAVTYEY